MIKLGTLVRWKNKEDALFEAGLTISSIYCTVITRSSQEISVSQETLVVDVLSNDILYKKIPIDSLEKVRKDEV